MQLRTWGLGAAVPLAGVLSGELLAEADIESFAFEVEGGGDISAAIPAMHGRELRARHRFRVGVACSAVR